MTVLAYTDANNEEGVEQNIREVFERNFETIRSEGTLPPAGHSRGRALAGGYVLAHIAVPVRKRDHY